MSKKLSINNQTPCVLRIRLCVFDAGNTALCVWDASPAPPTPHAGVTPPTFECYPMATQKNTDTTHTGVLPRGRRVLTKCEFCGAALSVWPNWTRLVTSRVPMYMGDRSMNSCTSFRGIRPISVIRTHWAQYE